MNSDHGQTLESNIPRRGRPRKNLGGPPPKSKSNLGPALSGVRKSKPRAVKLVLPNVKTAVQNLAKVTNKSSSEIVKNFPLATAPSKDSPPITTFLLTPADGKTGTLASVSKSGSLPMTLVQHVTTSGPTSIKQLPVAVPTTIFPRVQVSNAIGSTPKLLLITTASNSAASVPITSTNQTLCKTLLPIKLGNNTPTSGSVVAGNLGKQVLYKIPSSQSSGMVLLSTTTPSQAGGTQKKFLLIPNSTTTKRQGNAAVILNSKISQSINPNSDKPLIAITSQTQTTCTLNDSCKIPTTIVPISNLPETTGKKLTRQSAVNSSSPTKPVNTSRRRGSVLGANSTISSIPSDIFKTVACTTNSRGICSTPVSVQTSQKQSNVKVTQLTSGLAPHGPLITEPGQQMCVLTPDASLNMTIPTVPQASLNTNPPTSNPHCRLPPVNISKPSQIQCQSDTKPNSSSDSMHAKRSRPLPGHRAKKTIPKIDGGTTPSFITVPSSLPFSAIQLKPNCANAALSASSFSGLSLLVSPNTIHQSSPNSENETKTNGTNTLTKHKNIPKYIVVNGVSNGSFPPTQSAGSQTSNNDCKSHPLSANQYSQCSQNLRPIYASPPKLTIAPGFTPTDKKGSELGRRKRPSELMIIKEREEFIDDSLEKSNIDDLSPPKLQREDEPFNFEMTSQESSLPSSYLPLAKLTSTAQTQSTSELYDLKDPLLLSSSSSSSTITNQHQPFLQDIKPMVRKDNFPTLASLSAMNSKYSEFISRLDQNKKISFGHLFNHFKLLADKKKSKNASAIMFQVAHSIHCCVVLATMDIKRSVDLNDLPFCVKESMNCSVKCRQTFMKELFAEKAISSLIDPRFSLSILKSSDSTGERPSRCYRSRGLTNSSSANEDVSFSSNVTSSLLNIKTKLPDDDGDDDDEYLPDQQVLTNPNPNSNPNYRKSTTGLTLEASTQKSATDESFTSCFSCSTGNDCKCSMQCTQNPGSESTNTKPLSYSTVPKECSISTSCKNSSGKGKKRGNSESAGSSQHNSSYTIQNGCNNMSELSSVLKVSSPSSTPQEFRLPGTLHYKIVPKGHISLSGNNSQVKDSNSMNSISHQTKIPVQSYIINGDKSTINPIRTISPILTHPTELYENKTKTLTEPQLVRKRKYVKSQKNSGDDSPSSKKLCISKTKDTPSRKKSTSSTKSPKGSSSKSPKLSSSKSPKLSSTKSPKASSTKSPKASSSKSPKLSCSKSPASTKLTVPLPETPLPLRDPKHLYDEPTTVDRVVMLTPDGKPILTDADLQITFDESVNCLTNPKKKGRYLKGKSPIKSLETKCRSILKNRSPKSPAKGKHSKTAKNQFPPPPKLNFLLKEIDHKLKHKYLSSSSSSLKTDSSTNDSMFNKTDKSKKANIEKIISNIASGYPAFGTDSPRCTMKLYKYFVSTRIKNRAKKNGSHEINVPLTLYINWKTLSRQPFNKHRITSHALNVMAIKKAKQFSNYKKCKIRTRKPKPMKKKKRYFVARRKGLQHISNNSRAKKNSNSKSTKKKYYKKKSSKTKKYIKKTSSSSKKKAQALILARRAKAKKKKMMMKTEKTPNNSALAPIVEKGCLETLVNDNDNDDARKSKTLKPARKNLIVKKKKQLKEKRTAKKAVQFTICSSLPALRTTRSRVALAETPETDSKKLDSLCTAVSQIKTEPESTEIKTPDTTTTTTELNQQEMLNEQTYSNESPPPPPQPSPTPPVHPIKSVEDENLPTQSKFEVADLIKKEKQTPAIDAKQDIPNSQHGSEENNESNISSSESATNSTTSSHSSNVKTVAIRNQAHYDQQKLTSSTKTQHSKTLAQPANALQPPVSEEDDTKIEPPTEIISLPSASNSADETAEVATQKQLASPTVIEDSGNFIFEDDTDSSLPVKDISISSCSSSSSSQDKQLNSMHSNSSAENNQPVISNTNSNTPLANIIPTIRSSAFSDKFDIGLSPQLARIQQLKDQLQEKQKALDLAKLCLK